MRVGIDPKNDYAFKRLFGHEQELPLLFALLEAVLEPPPGRRLAQLDLLNPFNEKEALDDKLSVLDIKARDQGGWQYNVEMQLLTPGPFKGRVLYYWARFHQGQLTEGQGYTLLRPTISVCFVSTPLFPELPDYHQVFALIEQRHHVVFNDHLLVHILELAKFTKTAADLATPLDRWLYFLRHAEGLDPAALPPQLDEPEIRRALEVLANMNQSTIERERYEARQKYLHDAATWQEELAQARAGMEQARAGMEQARAGMEQARADMEQARADMEQAHAEAERQRADKEAAVQAGLVHRVQFCERLLGRTPTADEQLRSLPDRELERLAAQLEAEASQTISRRD
jgi:predicted transposase/invertase (TIGR01784 family)